jgi:hypothetical protein
VESGGLEARQSAAIFALCWSLAIYIERIKGSGVDFFFFFIIIITMVVLNRNYELQK